MRTSFAVAAAVISALLTTNGPARADDKVECINAAQNAQSLRNEKKLSEAREGFLLCSREVCPAVVRNDCAKWLSEVDAATSSVVIRARDGAGHDIVDVRVSIDGKEVATRLAGSALAVNPGEHKFRYEAAGQPVVEDTVLIAEGEKGRLLRVDLGATTTTTTDGSLKPDVSDSTQASGKSVAPWIIGGVGVASLLGFGVSEILLQGEVSSLKSGCGAAPAHCQDSDLSTARSERTVAEITLGVGLVGLAVAVPWIILQGGKKDAAKPAAMFDVRTTRGGAEAVVVGSF